MVGQDPDVTRRRFANVVESDDAARNQLPIVAHDELRAKFAL
jgi:hypothetical protein